MEVSASTIRFHCYKIKQKYQLFFLKTTFWFPFECTLTRWVNNGMQEQSQNLVFNSIGQIYPALHFGLPVLFSDCLCSHVSRMGASTGFDWVEADKPPNKIIARRIIN